MILAGDVGGTKCNLALFEKDAGKFHLRHQSRFSSREFPQFSGVVDAFLSETRDRVGSSVARKIVAAGFGVAGPVIGKKVRVTNLSWELDADLLAKQIGTSCTVLLNDLEATGYGLAWLEPS